MSPFFGLVTTADLNNAVAGLTKQIKALQEAEMTTQADVDALTQQVDTIATDLATSQGKLQAEIDALAAANPSLDLTGLQNAVAPLDAAVVALGGLTPTQAKVDDVGGDALDPHGHKVGKGQADPEGHKVG
jgi:septal ring factor EnvC (AmiA/AmiB activator)